MNKRFLWIILSLVILFSSNFAQEDISSEELEKIENYGNNAYLIYLGALTILGIGVIIGGLLIQNNLGTKNTLIYTTIIILIALIIKFY